MALTACTKDLGRDPGISGYPHDVDRIIRGRCATAGCHNDRSSEAAAGLDLSRWEQMIAGGRNGPAVIPYRCDYSPLCFYINRFEELGPALSPTMPLNGEPLSRPEVETLFSWVNAGAPDLHGNIPFATLPARQKLYVTNRLCDVVTVLDARTGLPIRYVDAGVPGKNDFPADVQAAPAGDRWLVTFLAHPQVQVFDGHTNQPEGFIDPGPGQWLTAIVAGDGRTAFLADHSAKGRIVVADLVTRGILNVLAHPSLKYPRSLHVNNDSKKLYVGAEGGNAITMVEYNTDPAVYTTISLDGQAPHDVQGTLDPWLLAGDDATQRLWVGCVSAKKVVEIDMRANQVVATVALGDSPTALAFDAAGNRLFVSFMDDNETFPDHRGSVVVVDLASHTVTHQLRAGYQSAGLWCSREGGFVAVVNSNVDDGGPAPHHVSGCAGRNGYLSFIDLQTLQVQDRRYELAVFPFSISGAR